MTEMSLHSFGKMPANPITSQLKHDSILVKEEKYLPAIYHFMLCDEE